MVFFRSAEKSVCNTACFLSLYAQPSEGWLFSFCEFIEYTLYILFVVPYLRASLKRSKYFSRADRPGHYLQEPAHRPG